MDTSIYFPHGYAKPRKTARLAIRLHDTDIMHLDRLVKFTNKGRSHYDQVDRSKLIREMITRAVDGVNQLELGLKKNS